MAVLAFTAHTPEVRPLFAAPSHVFDDRRLYREIVDRVGRGEDYYTAARAEQLAHNYPVHPPIVFREPALAWTLALLRTDVARKIAVILLAMLATVIIRKRLDETSVPGNFRLVATIAMATGAFIAGIRDAPFLHEVWAALLVTLSLAVWYPRRWLLSVGLGLAACLLRELAVPYLAVMLAFAIWERRRTEAATWLLAMVAFGVLFSLHLHAAAAAAGNIVGAASPGWLCFGGWPQALASTRWNLLFHLLPASILSLLVCCSFVGFAGWRDAWVSRCGVTACGYLLAMTIFGRPDNDYWGILYTPVLPLGLALAPHSMSDILGRALESRRPLGNP
jgi:hypothetical protein